MWHKNSLSKGPRTSLIPFHWTAWWSCSIIDNAQVKLYAHSIGKEGPTMAWWCLVFRFFSRCDAWDDLGRLQQAAVLPGEYTLSVFSHSDPGHQTKVEWLTNPKKREFCRNTLRRKAASPRRTTQPTWSLREPQTRKYSDKTPIKL